MGMTPSLYLFKLADSPKEQTDIPTKEIQGPSPNYKIYQALWGPLNETIFTSNEDGTIRIYDTETGKQIKIINEHTKAVNRIQFDKKSTYIH